MITVAGLTPSLDLTYTVPALELGQIHRVPDVIRCAGGKALNMARAATAVGADCTVVAILGGPTGALVSELLRREDSHVVAVASPSDTRICVSIADPESGQLTEIYQEASAVPAAVWTAFHAEVAGRLQDGRGWLSISGRAPAGAGDAIAELVRLGRDLGVSVAVDSYGEALGRALLAGPTLVKVNRSEAAGELGRPADHDLLEMARQLRDRSGATVVLTDGEAGSVAVDAEEAVQATAPGIRGGYPVGSGDSFLGGLLAALDRGQDLSAALRAATACGVANALTPGQGHFTLDEVERVAAAVQLRPLG